MGRGTVAGIVTLWVFLISIIVNRIVPEPYMDEIFHIPQAQRFCRGDFQTWDPMITTPPGLYYLGLTNAACLFPVMWFTKAASSLSDICSTSMLRSVNGLQAIICSLLVYDLLIHLRPTLGERKATTYAILMALYPVHWFFTFLYYTDVASVTAVLAMYLASLKRLYWLSAVLGAFATFFRQTNIVWMLFVAASAAVSYTHDLNGKDYVQRDNCETKIQRSDVFTDEMSIQTAPNLRKRRMGSSADAIELFNSEMSECSSCQTPDLTAGFLDEILDIVLKLWCLKWKLLISFAPFIMVLVVFMTFVICNGSIVLGAKEAHVVSLHFPQILYFGLVSAAALTPVHFSSDQAASLCRSLGKNKILSSFQVLMALIIGFIAVHFFSMAHPYLLADNRHYTFYIWRKVIQAHWTMKYLLVPLYVYSWFSIISILGKVQKKIWILFFFLACAAVLIPAPLIEFRYYTIPFYFVILHSQLNDTNIWLLMAAYVAVDIFTMTMFLFRPFHWDHESGTQRFIW